MQPCAPPVPVARSKVPASWNPSLTRAPTVSPGRVPGLLRIQFRARVRSSLSCQGQYSSQKYVDCENEIISCHQDSLLKHLLAHCIDRKWKHLFTGVFSCVHSNCVCMLSWMQIIHWKMNRKCYETAYKYVYTSDGWKTTSCNFSGDGITNGIKVGFLVVKETLDWVRASADPKTTARRAAFSNKFLVR